MKKKTIIQMMIGILFLLTLIISSTYAYFNIVNTSSNNTTSNYNAKLEDIEKYGTSLLTGGEGELHLRVKASDMTPSKIGNKYYATTSEDDYQLRKGNHIVSNATIQKGLSNYEYNCTSKLTITLDGTMVSEDGLQVGDAKLYLKGTNNNIKNEEYDLKTLIDELELNDDGKKEYTREIEYLLTSDNEGKVMIDVEFANNNNNQTTSSGKNLNIEITNSELVCGLGNDKIYASLDTYISGGYGEKYRVKEYKDKIITASFVKSKPNEEELTTKPMYWDLTDTSKSEEGSVIGWLEEREETDTYDLYIGSDKEIYTTTLITTFYNMKNLQEIKFDNLNTSENTSMYGMFEYCTSLTSLNLSNIDTSKVTDMGSMFYNSKITDLDLSHFDTSKVTNMSWMFSGSNKLSELDLSSFDTSKVTNMSSMFYNCSKLTSIDVSHFDTAKVESMSSMFNGCNGLTSLDISQFDISKVTNMSNMFNGLGVKSLEDIKGLYEFDTSKVTDIGGIFADCKNITEIDLTKFELDNVTNMSYMFSGLDSITSTEQIKGFEELNTSKVTNMNSMFYNSKITDLDLSNFDTSSVTNMSSMFYGSKIADLDVSSFDTSSVTNMSSMFYGLDGITSIDQIKGFKELATSKVTNMNSMFYNSKITDLDLSNFDTSSVTNMSFMFCNSKIIDLDVSSFETPLLVNTQYMFSGCTNLKELKLNKATFDKVTSYDNMFRSVQNDIHLTIKKGQEDFINKRLNDAYPNGHNATIDVVD